MGMGAGRAVGAATTKAAGLVALGSTSAWLVKGGVAGVVAGAPTAGAIAGHAGRGRGGRRGDPTVSVLLHAGVSPLARAIEPPPSDSLSSQPATAPVLLSPLAASLPPRLEAAPVPTHVAPSSALALENAVS